MKKNMTQTEIGLVCDVHWFIAGVVYASRMFRADCPFDEGHLRAMDKAVGILKENRDED